jgi:hypothetical protein
MGGARCGNLRRNSSGDALHMNPHLAEPDAIIGDMRLA